ncbi:hypothetical protein [Benzoatithermus flavus]|uniref:Transposase n=1 Tax=Benzoatithermus flavus TaxID=3108223 RepID=A0ABU8XM20_9PROT
MTLYVSGKVRWEQAQYLKSLSKEQRRAAWGHLRGTLLLGSLLSITYMDTEEGRQRLEEAKAREADLMAYYAALKAKGRRRVRGRRRYEIWWDPAYWAPNRTGPAATGT